MNEELFQTMMMLALFGGGGGGPATGGGGGNGGFNFMEFLNGLAVLSGLQPEQAQPSLEEENYDVVSAALEILAEDADNEALKSFSLENQLQQQGLMASPQIGAAWATPWERGPGHAAFAADQQYNWNLPAQTPGVNAPMPIPPWTPPEPIEPFSGLENQFDALGNFNPMGGFQEAFEASGNYNPWLSPTRAVRIPNSAAATARRGNGL